MMATMITPDITLYGIANCDTVKKARAWFSAQGLDYHFHDFKKHGVPADQLPVWMDALGWDKLLNRQGTTWRKLDAATQASVHDAASASALLQTTPAPSSARWCAGTAPVPPASAWAWTPSAGRSGWPTAQAPPQRPEPAPVRTLLAQVFTQLYGRQMLH